MRILLLGGTAFLGRATALHALSRGHDVTCAARGSAPAPDGCAFIPIDRDEDDGLAPVAADRWDAVIDVSRKPRHVERAVRDLDTEHWVLVSTASVYPRFDRREQPETAATVPPLDDLDDEADYGRAKVTCEQLVRAAPATSTVIRAGLIGGPGDLSRRSGYYPWRFAHPTGDDVIVPDDREQATALIDVDDLAAWTVHAAEQRLDGIFNATGETTTLAEVVELSAQVAGSRAVPRWVDSDALRDAGVSPWSGACSLPLWIDDGDMRWFATLDTRAARAAGLTTRPLRETLARVLEFEEVQSDELADRPRAGLSDDDERRVRQHLDGAAARDD
ncbi:NAD-dependent epimerase/dehydratase family protein [Demequina sp. NBRC 110053]|uniref:NAD-dependent epimerase/dehydratase family protein n=1 Tax=Demequina sp. NBRC 110053 TaxID=1570342 RepID=UPI000A078938|nr:NAD-dependent epimerase/dehydratase family protein [Demequina sp. NBRC 110053]